MKSTNSHHPPSLASSETSLQPSPISSSTGPGNHPRLAYSIPEAVKVTSIGRTKIYGLIQSGQLPIVKIGARTVIRHDDLVMLLQDNLFRQAA